MTPAKNIKTNTPRIAIILVGLLALFQITRVSAFPIIQDALSGANAEAWLFPAMMDVFIGVCALFVALGVWRGKGLLVWIAAIVFFALSISDHFDAMATLLTTKGPNPATMNSSTISMLVVMSLVEAAAIWALASKSMRAYYLAH
jgi:hypothetical protein